MKKIYILVNVIQFISIVVIGIVLVFMFDNSNKTIVKNIKHNINQVIEIITYDANHNIISQGTGLVLSQ